MDSIHKHTHDGYMALLQECLSTLVSGSTKSTLQSQVVPSVVCVISAANMKSFYFRLEDQGNAKHLKLNTEKAEIGA